MGWREIGKVAGAISYRACRAWVGLLILLPEERSHLRIFEQENNLFRRITLNAVQRTIQDSHWQTVALRAKSSLPRVSVQPAN